jgi:hypothetical protein
MAGLYLETALRAMDELGSTQTTPTLAEARAEIAPRSKP